MDGCIWISGFAVIILKYLLAGCFWIIVEIPGVYTTHYSVRVVFGPSRVRVGQKISSTSRVSSTRRALIMGSATFSGQLILQPWLWASHDTDSLDYFQKIMSSLYVVEWTWKLEIIQIMTPFCIFPVHTCDQRNPLGNIPRLTLQPTLKSWKYQKITQQFKEPGI